MSDITKSNRVRGPNFTKEEQMLLCKIAKAYTGMIECKKTDGVKQAQKQEAWRKIQEVFNSNTKAAPRTVDNLLACYRNMKSKIKKQHSNAKMVLQDPLKRNALIESIDENGRDWNAVSFDVKEPAEVCESGFMVMQKDLKKMESQHKKAIMGTGGGPPTPGNENEPLLKLKKLIEPQVDGLFTIYDGDAILMTQYQESLPDNEKTLPIEYDMENDTNNVISQEPEETSKEENIIISTPLRISNRVDLLRKRKSTPLSTSNDNEKPASKATTNTCFLRLAQDKLELVQLQKQLLEKELIIKNLEIEDKIKENKHKELIREKELLLLDIKVNNLKNN